MRSLTDDKNSWMGKIDPGLSTIIVITLDLTRRFESDFFWGFKFSFGFYLTTFWLYPNSKKQKSFTIFAYKIFFHIFFDRWHFFFKNSHITNKKVIEKTRDDLLKIRLIR